GTRSPPSARRRSCAAGSWGWPWTCRSVWSAASFPRIGSAWAPAAPTTPLTARTTEFFISPRHISPCRGVFIGRERRRRHDENAPAGPVQPGPLLGGPELRAAGLADPVRLAGLRPVPAALQLLRLRPPDAPGAPGGPAGPERGGGRRRLRPGGPGLRRPPAPGGRRHGGGGQRPVPPGGRHRHTEHRP